MILLQYAAKWADSLTETVQISCYFVRFSQVEDNPCLKSGKNQGNQTV